MTRKNKLALFYYLLATALHMLKLVKRFYNDSLDFVLNVLRYDLELFFSSNPYLE